MATRYISPEKFFEHHEYLYDEEIELRCRGSQKIHERRRKSRRQDTGMKIEEEK